MDTLKINKAQSEGNSTKYARNQKQSAKWKKAFIKADDENVHRCMKYEEKILELKAEIKRLKAGHNSGKQSKVLETVERPV
ncbi:MAG TPA: hypothetical protein VH796_16050 [Nitrososphaeraceae archaeon]|jgi:uncharacterized small protein (DUF1192 family)